MQPWRETKLPWLINGRESCLMNSMTYLNRSHLQSINVINVLNRRQVGQKKTFYTFEMMNSGQGCVTLRKLDPNAAIAEEQKTTQAIVLAGKRRTRADLETEDNDSFSASDEFCNRHGVDIDFHERLLE